jgi:hypothetical protein
MSPSMPLMTTSSFCGHSFTRSREIYSPSLGDNWHSHTLISHALVSVHSQASLTTETSFKHLQSGKISPKVMSTGVTGWTT